MPVEEVEKMNEAENGDRDKSIKTPENEEAVEASGSQPVTYYLKHNINEKLIKGLVNNNNRFNNLLCRTNNKEGGYRRNFEIPCSIGDLKHVNALVDQGFDVNVMPYSTYIKLTDERLAETDIRLSLASHSYNYPLGIAEDVLVEVISLLEGFGDVLQCDLDSLFGEVKRTKTTDYTNICSRSFLTVAGGLASHTIQRDAVINNTRVDGGLMEPDDDKRDSRLGNSDGIKKSLDCADVSTDTLPINSEEIFSHLFDSNQDNNPEGSFLRRSSRQHKILARLKELIFMSLRLMQKLAKVPDGVESPDMLYAVHCLCQFMHAPCQSHLKLAFHVLRYLNSSLGTGVCFKHETNLNLYAYVDSDWAKCKVTRKSVT
ncbi:MAK10-like protein [Tanacetum coccineum]|uniref:MAK10-like protein n=1 Tax=Tanacetum coccineum TaxID=301880 RepID=A0ABQ5E788_9ASTR